MKLAIMMPVFMAVGDWPVIGACTNLQSSSLEVRVCVEQRMLISTSLRVGGP